MYYLALLMLIGCCHGAFKLDERYSWNQLDFVFPTQQMKDLALASGTYIPQNALPVGIEHWGNRLFVTVPRWRDGIPATLTYIDTAQTISGSPQLIPYPDWQSNAVGDCANGLNTVYRIKADKCGRLWVLDTGTIGIGNTTQNVCPYSVNVFDLATNTRIRRYEFRADDTNVNTFIANTAVDIGRSCEDTFAYFSDELGYGLIVYSWEQNRSWRFEHSYFYPDPLRGDFNIAGQNFQWGDEGIFGMALSPIRSDGFRTLYFSPLASHREFAVSTRILRDESRAEDSYHDFFFFPTERGPNSHTTARVCSDDGVMLFNLIDQNAVGCWHTTMPYEPNYHGVVDRDDVGLIFPADVKVDENRNVWVISDRMSIFLNTNLNYNDINFRIFTTSLKNLIAGTVCDISTQVSSRYALNSILSSIPSKSGLFPTSSTSSFGTSLTNAIPAFGSRIGSTIGSGIGAGIGSNLGSNIGNGLTNSFGSIFGNGLGPGYGPAGNRPNNGPTNSLGTSLNALGNSLGFGTGLSAYRTNFNQNNQNFLPSTPSPLTNRRPIQFDPVYDVREPSSQPLSSTKPFLPPIGSQPVSSQPIGVQNFGVQPNIGLQPYGLQPIAATPFAPPRPTVAGPVQSITYKTNSFASTVQQSSADYSSGAQNVPNLQNIQNLGNIAGIPNLPKSANNWWTPQIW